MKWIVVIDPQPMTSTGIISSLKNSGFNVTDTFVTSEENLHPSLIIFDPFYCQNHKLCLIKEFKTNYPGSRLLAFSNLFNKQNISILQFQGINGCISKMAPFEEICQAIKFLKAGKAYWTPPDGLLEPSEKPANNLFSNSFSAREEEILLLLGTGHKRQDISKKLSISPRTVDTYMARLKESLAIKSNSKLVKFAYLLQKS